MSNMDSTLVDEVERLCRLAASLRAHRDPWLPGDAIDRAYETALKELELACRKLNEFWAKEKSA